MEQPRTESPVFLLLKRIFLAQEQGVPRIRHDWQAKEREQDTRVRLHFALFQTLKLQAMLFTEVIQNRQVYRVVVEAMGLCERGIERDETSLRFMVAAPEKM